MARVKWPTWQQAAIAAVVSGIIAIVLARRRRSTGRTPPGFGEAFATEFALISALYSIWRIARKLPLAQDAGAIERARTIVDVQEAMYLPSELGLQEFILDNDWLGWPTTLYYEDLSEIFGPSIYGPVGTGVSDQFAAMPSIHVGWAAVVSFGIVAASTSRWRWLALLHVIITMIVVSATGNHWWLDGIVAIALLGVGLALDTAFRRGGNQTPVVPQAAEVDQVSSVAGVSSNS